MDVKQGLAVATSASGVKISATNARKKEFTIGYFICLTIRNFICDYTLAKIARQLSRNFRFELPLYVRKPSPGRDASGVVNKVASARLAQVAVVWPFCGTAGLVLPAPVPVFAADTSPLMASSARLFFRFANRPAAHEGGSFSACCQTGASDVLLEMRVVPPLKRRATTSAPPGKRKRPCHRGSQQNQLISNLKQRVRSNRP